MRVFLEYANNSVELILGENAIGRGLSNSIRFNDGSISRRHIMLRFDGKHLEIEDLGSSNGTLVNGTRLAAVRGLTDGDEIRLGKRVLRVRTVSDVVSNGLFEEPTANDAHSGEIDVALASRGRTPAPPPGPTTKPTREVPRLDAGLVTAAFAEEPTASPTPLPLAMHPTPELPIPVIEWRNCPYCRGHVPADLDRCTGCMRVLSANRPTVITQSIKLPSPPVNTDTANSLPKVKDRRDAVRVTVELPVLYASDTLTLDAVARDLSLGGVFVATELLDDIGTKCRVTFLPDGAPPVVCAGEVCRAVVAHVGADGRPPGLGIRFTQMGRAAAQWISNRMDIARTQFGTEEDTLAE